MGNDDKIRLAKALTIYKDSLRVDMDHDLYEYNRIETLETDDLAKRLDLVGDYYELEKRGR